MYKIFIDGNEGTTGLLIDQRFAGRNDITVLRIDPDKRKDLNARLELLNQCDIGFLCLPDAAAKEIAALADHKVRLLDTSTAHRTNPAYTYGFPALSPAQRKSVASATRVAVPGCHASGAISILYPLIAGGVADDTYPFSINSITGYTGGGKKMVAQYEDPQRDPEYDSPRQYALSQSHKHIPEILSVCGLKTKPVFQPIVADFPQGMVVTVGLHTALLNKKITPAALRELYASHYAGQYFIEVMPEGEPQSGFLPANTLAGSNKLQLFVTGNDEIINVAARFDNLGKGASGAAIQCMNIMLGLDETTGLV
jgi:N-acetyl-gamma-glutamyl-phosphate reductase